MSGTTPKLHGFLLAWVICVASSFFAAHGQSDSFPDAPGFDLAMNGESTQTATMQLEETGERGPVTVSFGDSLPASQGLVELCACSCGKSSEQCCCNKKKMAELNTAVATAHKGVFYLNDFSYLRDPCYCDWWPGDNLKNLTCGEHVTLDVGGQFRMRYHGEQNFRSFGPAGGIGLTGVDDDFLLYRTRLYADMKVGCNFRVFAEYIDAVSNYEDFPSRPIEENRSDMQNLFVDALLLDGNAGSLTGRAGRQELLYGQQRLISPLDWANTRRTFDGGKLFWNGGNWNVDGFWTRPLRRDFGSFDSPDLDRQFYGIWSSYKGLENGKLDAYWLGFDNDVTGFRVDSLGVNYQRDVNNWMLDIWGDYQFGTNADNSTHNAGAWTLGVGRKFCHSWKPALWVYYDWASGTSDQGAGNGYFHFFPLVHKYLGFMDFFGRRNIETPNVQFTCQPHKKLKLLLWYYYFFLENRNDTPYNVVMTPFFPGIRPSSANLGHEIDATATYIINPRTNLLLGYSHFFSGEYYDTPGLPYSGDADFFYTQFQFNF